MFQREGGSCRPGVGPEDGGWLDLHDAVLRGKATIVNRNTHEFYSFWGEMNSIWYHTISKPHANLCMA